MTEQSEPLQPNDFNSPIAPPTHIDANLQQPQQTAWPTILGTVMLVFGILAMLGACLGSVTPLLADLFASILPDEEDAMLVAGGWAWFVVSSSIVLMSLAGLQITGGLGLLRRRAWAVRASVIWAIAKIVVVTVNIVPNYMMQMQQMSEQNDTAGLPGGTESFVLAILILSVLFGLLWGWALPVFSLFWFARSKIKQETAQWRATANSAPSA